MNKCGKELEKELYLHFSYTNEWLDNAVLQMPIIRRKEMSEIGDVLIKEAERDGVKELYYKFESLAIFISLNKEKYLEGYKDDLISRQWTIRKLREHATGRVNQDYVDGLEYAIAFIAHTVPTAYDIDKVVEQIEEHRKNASETGNFNVAAAHEEDKKIIRKGGVNV